MILWWGKKKQPDPKTGETPIEPLKPGETPTSPVASLPRMSTLPGEPSWSLGASAASASS